MSSSDDESRSTVPVGDNHAMNPWAKPAVTIEIQEVEIHWSAIGSLLLGLLTLPLLLMTAGGGLLGSFEAPSALLPNDMYDDYAWVASNWMFLHLMAFLVCMPFFVMQRKWDSAEWASSVLALLYCLHQFEEHAWDVTGSRYPFARHLAGIVGPCTLDVNIAVVPWKTNSILGPFFAQDSVAVTGDCGFDEHVILWINVYFVVGALFIMPVFVLPFGCRDFALLQNACLVAVNGLCFHMAPAAASGKYNPGLLQSIFMNTPFAIFVIVFLYRSGRVSSFQLVVAFFMGGLPGQPAMLMPPIFLRQAGLMTKAQQHTWFLCAPVILSLVASLMKAPCTPSEAVAGSKKWRAGSRKVNSNAGDGKTGFTVKSKKVN